MTKLSLSEELTWRGFVNQTTLGDINDLNKEKLIFYWGVDPSAPSMTVGNFAAAMMVRHFIDYGHQAILLVGGATGLIGDPDGKDEERSLSSKDEVAKNKQAIAEQYRKIFAGKDFQVVDNFDWFKELSYLQFLREVGKNMPMTQLLDREFVQARIGRGGKGISYAEFSYSLIQAYDFLHLFRNFGVTLQVSGADQWGNSIAGVELIRKLEGKQAHVWTGPLIINTITGRKFGKSEKGAVWLNSALTSVFEFYQFWLNVDDKGVETYLKIFTLLNREEISDIMHLFNENPGKRAAQKALAYEVTKIVHGLESANQAREAAESLSGNSDSANMPQVEIEGHKHKVSELLVKSGLASSSTQAANLLRQGGVKLNHQKISDEVIEVDKNDLLQVGKHRFVRIILK